MSWRSHGRDNASLVDALERNGIVKTPEVARGMRLCDRGCFVSAERDAGSPAYSDTPLDIGFNVTISAPHMHGYCLELLAAHLGPGMAALDVGSGSGYLTAVMAAMLAGSSADGAWRAVGIEHIPELAETSRRNIQGWLRTAPKDGNGVVDRIRQSDALEIREGDAFVGCPGEAFDAIHVGAAAPRLPQNLVEQLKPGGRMVIPIGTASQDLVVVDKDDRGHLTLKKVMGVRYVPLTSREKQLGSR